MVDANAGGSCITSAQAMPIGSAPVRPVITMAERLNVSSWSCESAVASPLSRLSSTY